MTIAMPTMSARRARPPTTPPTTPPARPELLDEFEFEFALPVDAGTTVVLVMVTTFPLGRVEVIVMAEVVEEGCVIVEELDEEVKDDMRDELEEDEELDEVAAEVAEVTGTADVVEVEEMSEDVREGREVMSVRDEEPVCE